MTSPTRSATGTTPGSAAGASDTAQLYQGDLVGAAAQFGELVAEAKAAHDGIIEALSLAGHSVVLAYQGDTAAARAAAAAAVETAAELGGIAAAQGCAASTIAALAAGMLRRRGTRCEAWPDLSAVPQYAAVQRDLSALAALAGGDLAAARRWADEAVSTSTGYHLSAALATRARAAIAQGEPEEGERDAHDALACAAEVEAYLLISNILECLGGLAGDAGSHREAARLFGAAHAIRERSGAVRLSSGSRATKPTSRRCEMRWARKTLNPRGPRAPPYRSRRRSLMRSAVAVNANARRPAGGRSRPPSVTWCGWSVRD